MTVRTGVKTEVSEYLRNLPKAERDTLGIIRKQILKLIPNAEERLSRGVPFFYYKGKRAVGFRSSKAHLSFFIMEGNVLNKLRREISAYNNSSTVIKFTAEKPLYEEIIKKLVQARIEEMERNSARK